MVVVGERHGNHGNRRVQYLVNCISSQKAERGKCSSLRFCVPPPPAHLQQGLHWDPLQAVACSSFPSLSQGLLRPITFPSQCTSLPLVPFLCLLNYEGLFCRKVFLAHEGLTLPKWKVGCDLIMVSSCPT